jgi:peptidyl-prolyl cis-trans isomerase D
MSVIQKIRDKYARIAVVAIALALLGFIAMDAFTGKSQLFGASRSNTIGSVNGKTIRVDDFNKNFQLEEQNVQQQSQGMLSGSALTERAMENLWGREISKALLAGEVNKLGITVTEKELNNSILYGNNPPADLRQQFTNQETGEYDAQALAQQLREIKKNGRKEQKDQINAYLDQLILARKEEKYTSLLRNSINVPKWILEKQNADNNQQSRISYVRQSYTEIPDSSVKVTDQEIADYISKHKSEYKQEESRSIAYVAFSALPNAADSASAKAELDGLKSGFAAATDADAYISKYGTSVTTTGSMFVGKSEMQMAMKDTLQKLSVGAVFGPYVDAGSMALAKMLEIKTLGDSIKCRHILIGTTDRNGQPLMEDSVAKQKADSIDRAIRAGANLDTLETRYTTDQAAHKDKGVMTFPTLEMQNMMQDGKFAKEFGDYLLNGKPGDKKVVKTSFGYHFIEILEFIKPEPFYKIAYLFKPIVPSPETDQKAQSDASHFAGEINNEKTFNEVFEKKWKPLGYNKGLAYDIAPNSYQVMGLGYDRGFVKDVYNADRGEILQPVKVNDNYVVAVVTDVYEKGTQSPAKARMMIEPTLRNKKKAELIKAKIGSYKTLEEVATKLGKQIETADSVRLNASNPGIGFEPKVIGAAISLQNNGKVITDPIEGSGGVYVVKVENITAVAETGANVDERRKMMIDQAKRQMPYPLQALREAASIKDNRAKFY